MAGRAGPHTRSATTPPNDKIPVGILERAKGFEPSTPQPWQGARTVFATIAGCTPIVANLRGGKEFLPQRFRQPSRQWPCGSRPVASPVLPCVLVSVPGKQKGPKRLPCQWKRSPSGRSTLSNPEKIGRVSVGSGASWLRPPCEAVGREELHHPVPE